MHRVNKETGIWSRGLSWKRMFFFDRERERERSPTAYNDGTAASSQVCGRWLYNRLQVNGQWGTWCKRGQRSRCGRSFRIVPLGHLVIDDEVDVLLHYCRISYTLFLYYLIYYNITMWKYVIYRRLCKIPSKMNIYYTYSHIIVITVIPSGRDHPFDFANFFGFGYLFLPLA